MNAESKPSQDALSLRQQAEQKLGAGGGETGSIEDSPARLVHELRVHRIELELQNEALREASCFAEASLAQFTELYELSPVPYLTLDRDGQISRVNHAAAALLGLVPGPTGALRLAAFIADDSMAAFRGFLGNLFADEGVGCCEVALRRGGGRPDDCVVQLEGRITSSGGGSIIALLDITERKRTHDALRRAVEDAERATAAKSRFLAAASHDLRQPLQTLYLISWVMARKTGDAQIRALLAEQDKALGGMSTMLNTLLDINLLDAGIISYHPVGLPVGPLLRQLGQDFAFQAGSANDVLHLVESGLIVQSDPKLLEQILRNLLSNAFKYTHGGRVLLGCRRRGDRVRIEVWDNGIGIPEDQLDSIFEEFHQVDNPRRKRSQGLGLGLAIVKRQAALLGHPIGVRSRPGKGSVFWVELPRGEVETALPASDPVADDLPAVPFHHRSVLLVEDDSSVGSMLEHLFAAEGCAVIRVWNADQALALARTPLDLVVTDYTLPGGLTGLDVLAQLRSVAATLPAILLTGDISTDSLRRIAAEPDCIHLFKPATTSEILRAAGTLLARSVCRFPPAEGRVVTSTVHVIDDDPFVCKAIAALLSEDDRDVLLYPNAETFLRSDQSRGEGCLVVDAVMPGMGGLAMLRHLRDQGNPIPTIVMTGHGDVPMAVAAMKAGAEDFITKPIDPEEMLAAVGRALELGRDVAAESARRAEAARCFAALTPRERQVLGLMLTGLSNKIIAHEMGISRRTVENHRAAIMSKTASKSLLDLYRISLLSGDGDKG